jgi:hypothetical protein
MRARTSAPRGSIATALRALRRRVFCFALGLDAQRAGQTDEPSDTAQLAARVPFAKALRQLVRHRPGSRRVPASRLLMGAQCRLDAVAFSEAIGSPRYGSMPMLDGPHVALLRQAKASPSPLDDDALRASAYFSFGAVVRDEWGDYFGATTDDELVAQTRNFLDWAIDDARRTTGNSGSPSEDGILVARVAGTASYAVVDGHHRVAKALADGATHLRVQRTWLSTDTPLRARLAGGAPPRCLEAPLPARDLEGVPVAHNMEARYVGLLRALGHDHAPGRLLEVGPGYGWLSARLKQRGWDVHVVVPHAVDASAAVGILGLARDDVLDGDAADLVAGLGGRFDAVACWGLDPAGTASDRADVVALLEAIDERTDLLVADADEACVQLVRRRTGLSRVDDLGACGDPTASTTRRLLAFAR